MSGLHFDRAGIAWPNDLGLIEGHGITLHLIGARSLTLANLVNVDPLSRFPFDFLTARSCYVSPVVLYIDVVNNRGIVDYGRVMARPAEMGVEAGTIDIAGGDEYPP